MMIIAEQLLLDYRKMILNELERFFLISIGLSSHISITGTANAMEISEFPVAI